MPLHPVPIIIGTTLAVIGSGYAFKKFIYDPHLAPLIEALIANHRQSLPSSPVARHHPVPVPVRSSASTTARRDHHTHLRRRSHRSSASGDHELREGSLYQRRAVEDGGASLYERKDPEITDGFPAPPISSLDIPLIDLESDDMVGESSEVKSVIFDYSSTPLLSGTSSPARGLHTPNPRSPSTSRPAPASFHADNSVNPFTTPISPSLADRPEDDEPSTTMSSLSLSPISTPPRPRSRLPSLDQWAGMDDTEDDLLSLPDTYTSTSEDTETSTSSSRGRHQSSPALSHVRLMVPSSRGPGSVVSLSESEGESDWEAVGH